MSYRMLIVFTSAVPLLWGPASHAQSSAEFFAGKTVKIVMGAAVGGEYGLYAQLIAQHIGKHVPGKPTVIVQSTPGAGGITALRYVANVAPRDGTVISVPHVTVIQDGLLDPKAQFDPGGFQWIGRLTSQLQVGVVSSKSNARSLADARTKELTAGGTAANNPTALNARILNALAGTKFKIVTGYQGTNEVMIAWERGEVDVLTTSWDLITARYGDKLKAGLAIPLYVYAMKRPPELSDVPTMTEFGRNDTEKAFLQIYTAGTEIGRSLAAPPGVPRDRLETWRAAFMKMLEDPEFKEAVSKGNIRLDPLAGEQLAAIVASVVALPVATVTKASEFYDRLLAEVK